MRVTAHAIEPVCVAVGNDDENARNVPLGGNASDVVVRVNDDLEIDFEEAQDYARIDSESQRG